MNVNELDRHFGDARVANDIFDYTYRNNPVMSALPEDHVRIDFFQNANNHYTYRRACLQAFLSSNPRYSLPRDLTCRPGVSRGSSSTESQTSTSTRYGLIATGAGLAGIVAKEYLHADLKPIADTILVGGTIIAAVLTARYAIGDFLRRR